MSDVPTPPPKSQQDEAVLQFGKFLGTVHRNITQEVWMEYTSDALRLANSYVTRGRQQTAGQNIPQSAIHHAAGDGDYGYVPDPVRYQSVCGQTTTFTPMRPVPTNACFQQGQGQYMASSGQTPYTQQISSAPLPTLAPMGPAATEAVLQTRPPDKGNSSFISLYDLNI
jgi:hypothetical protein